MIMTPNIPSSQMNRDPPPCCNHDSNVLSFKFSNPCKALILHAFQICLKPRNLLIQSAIFFKIDQSKQNSSTFGLKCFPTNMNEVWIKTQIIAGVGKLKNENSTLIWHNKEDHLLLQFPKKYFRKMKSYLYWRPIISLYLQQKALDVIYLTNMGS